MADRSTELTDLHVFQAASLSKPLTACAVMRLAGYGRIDLDAPIMRMLTRWRFPPSPFPEEHVTVRRILSHTAGLSLPDYPGFSPDQELPTLEASLSGATNGGGDLRIIAPAGPFRYSGGGFTLLQLLIEEITGERFADHMRAALLRPLGMEHSDFAPQFAAARPAATGHDAAGAPLPFYRFDALAAAGLTATAADLARFLAAQFDAPATSLMATPMAKTGCVDGMWPQYGLGYEIDRRPDGAIRFGHHGMNRGWRALMAADPTRRRALAALANSDAAMPALEALYQAWCD